MPSWRLKVMQSREDQNKAKVFEAFDTLFNKKDYATAERFWADNCIQHSTHFPPGRDGLFDLVRGAFDSACALQ
jgi:predicted SnoaL-like aldol condensation-catalyzing enzyme